MMNLLIIESPGKRKKLLEILATLQPGVTWKVEASVGHIRDLPATGQEPGHLVTGIKADFKPVYELSERGAEIVKKLKAIAKDADNVYLATDPDREGESISWHLQQALGLKSYIRVTFNEISQNAVKAALAAPRLIDGPMVAAQEARRVLDRLVGYMVSPELSRQTGEKLSAGRVQSPAVRLVVERERKIKAFVKTTHFGARLIFAEAKMGEWRADWRLKPDFISDENPYFLDKQFASLVSEVKQVVVETFSEGETPRKPPAPFTTSTLQQAASNALRFDPKKAMELAQKLFEQGHISYHRTDNPNVSDESMTEIRAVAELLGLDMVSGRREFKAKDGAQAGHPAITPTHWEVEEAGETQEERAVYRMIRVRAIASQLADARYAVRSTTLRAVSDIEGRAIAFTASGRTLLYPGWLKLLAEDDTEDDDSKDKEPANPVPLLEVGQTLDVSKSQLLEKITKPSPRFTLATLVKALETEGIGRPATYASILDNIMYRDYIREEKRYLSPTPTGEKVIDSLVSRFDFIELGYTCDLENDLDQIAQGKVSYTAVIQKLYLTLKNEVDAQRSVPTFRKPEVTFDCPDCSKELRRIAKSANGPFWACTACPTKLPDAGGKPGKKTVTVLSEYACKTCESKLVHRTKPGKGGYDFWGCSNFSGGCKTSYKNLNGAPDFS